MTTCPPDAAGRARAWAPRVGAADRDRLVLREFSTADLADVVALHRDPRLRTWLIDDFPLDQPAFAALFLERLHAFHQAHPGLGIWRAAGPACGFVGWFSLMPMSERPGAIELGSRLRPEVWGQGLALPGGEALLQHAFDALGHRDVWAACAEGNRSARLCLLALGFEAIETAPYEGGVGLHHRVHQEHWRTLRHLPRGARLRTAATALRSATTPGAARAARAPAEAGAAHPGT